MRRCDTILMLAVLLSSLAIPSATAAPWLAKDDGAPWPHRVGLETTGAGPIEEDISALGGRSFALLADRPTLMGAARMTIGAPGMPVPFIVRDTNGDGVGDSLFFASEYEGAYYLYFSEEAGPVSRGESGIVLGETSAGSWLPLHMPPTRTIWPASQKPNINPENSEQARALIASLRKRGPMIALSGPQCEVWIGKHSGLIERMRPTSYRWYGSCLREWASNLPNAPGSGDVEIVEQSPVRVRLRHRGDIIRDIEVWADGTIFTSGDSAWENAKLVVSAYPYSFARNEGEGRARRFSESIGMDNPLEKTEALALHGESGEGLACRATGARFARQAMWLDGGEIGWELAKDIMPRDGVRWGEFLGEATDLYRTLISGAMWVYDIQSEGESGRFRLDYRLIRTAEQPIPHAGMQRAAIGEKENAPEEAVPASGPPAQGPEISVRALARRVPRLHPNKGWGWQLKPFTRALDNPLPAYFELTLGNVTEKDIAVRVAVEAVPWLERVELLTEPETWKDAGGAEHSGFARREQLELKDGDYGVELDVPGGATGKCLLALKAIEESDGELSTDLRVVSVGAAARIPLKFEVVPNIPIITYQGEAPREPWTIREFGFNTFKSYGLPCRRDVSQWLTEDGRLTGQALEDLRHRRMELPYESHGLFTLEQLGLDQFHRNTGRELADPLASKLANLPRKELAEFLGKFVNSHRPWERFMIGYWGYDEVWEPINRKQIAVEDAAELYDAFRAASTKPLMHTFMIYGLDEGYPTRVPCDVPGGFHYSIDAEVQRYVKKLTGEHGRLFDGWLVNPDLRRFAPQGASAKPQYWFFLAAHLHVADYPMMRRQAWWCRYNNALEGGLGWWTFISGGFLYGNGVGCFAVLPTSEKDGFVLTDRALAMMDTHEDMMWITRLRIAQEALARRDDAAARRLLERSRELEAEALALSQRGEFDAARERVKRAAEVLL